MGSDGTVRRWQEQVILRSLIFPLTDFPQANFVNLLMSRTTPSTGRLYVNGLPLQITKYVARIHAHAYGRNISVNHEPVKIQETYWIRPSRRHDYARLHGSREYFALGNDPTAERLDRHTAHRTC